MVTFIEIATGSNEGSRFKIEPGKTIGRTQADILIKDPKISSTHGEFVLDGKGQLVLMDLGSANGIHINGRRVKKVALLPGVVFELGRTQLRVVSVEENQAIDFGRFVTWRGIVGAQLSTMTVTDERISENLQSLSPALKLTFIQGIQADEEIILGYGPRTAGSDSLDIELLDEDAPSQAFELRPGPGMVELKVIATGVVTLNNKSIDAEMLKDGDLISIGNTRIKVSYL